jgi:hypothetical protein
MCAGIGPGMSEKVTSGSTAGLRSSAGIIFFFQSERPARPISLRILLSHKIRGILTLTQRGQSVKSTTYLHLTQRFIQCAALPPFLAHRYKFRPVFFFFLENTQILTTEDSMLKFHVCYAALQYPQNLCL